MFPRVSLLSKKEEKLVANPFDSTCMILLIGFRMFRIDPVVRMRPSFLYLNCKVKCNNFKVKETRNAPSARHISAFFITYFTSKNTFFLISPRVKLMTLQNYNIYCTYARKKIIKHAQYSFLFAYFNIFSYLCKLYVNYSIIKE